MAGIAGFYGNGVGNVGRRVLARTLGFTGAESERWVSLPDFRALALSHGAEEKRVPRVVERDGSFMLVDGEIIGLDSPRGARLHPRDIPAACLDLFLEEGTQSLRRMNGSFSIAFFDERRSLLCLASDRMKSRPLFFMHGDGFLAFASRVESFNAMGLRPFDVLDPSGLFELLTIGCTVGTRSLWSGVSTLNPAESLCFDGETVTRNRYWRFRFTYRRGGKEIDEVAEELAARLKESVRRHTEGWDEVGLLLSGGLDSRAVLACLPGGVTSYTVCDGPNLETRIAARAAAMRGSRHVLMRREPDHYVRMVPAAARLCEGAYDYTHAHFEGLYHYMDGGDRVMLHGYRSGSMLRGAYLPHLTLSARGRTMKLPWMCEDTDLEDVEMMLLAEHGEWPFYLSLFRKEYRGAAGEYPRHLVRGFVEENRGSIVSPVDLLELFALENMFQWITFPNIICLRHNVPERSVLIDNNLFDLFASTPPELRFDSRIFRRALRILDPGLSSLVDANNLMPASPWVPPSLRTIGALSRSALKNATSALRKAAVPGGPVWTKTPGSWHDISELWRSGPLPGMLGRLLTDPEAMRDGVLDADGIRDLMREHAGGKVRHHKTLSALLTFLAWRAGTP